MPKLMTSDDLDVINVTGAGNFQFSAIRVEDLGATEYTLVTIVCDISGSVSGFDDDLLNAIKEIVQACQKSPRAENLLIRFLTFNENISEIHGFVNLSDIDINSYDPLHPSGTTSLFDATYDAVGATTEYSKRLIDQDFDCNGIVFVITDGMDNRSRMTPMSIKEKISTAVAMEEIESLSTILITLTRPGTSMEREIDRALDIFFSEAELTQRVDVGEATKSNLAKLANFVSQSISSQSQALGTGAPSQVLAL